MPFTKILLKFIGESVLDTVRRGNHVAQQAIHPLRLQHVASKCSIIILAGLIIEINENERRFRI